MGVLREELGCAHPAGYCCSYDLDAEKHPSVAGTQASQQTGSKSGSKGTSGSDVGFCQFPLYASCCTLSCIL